MVLYKKNYAYMWNIYMCMPVYICTKFESFKKSMHFSSINGTDIISAFSIIYSIFIGNGEEGFGD